LLLLSVGMLGFPAWLTIKIVQDLGNPQQAGLPSALLFLDAFLFLCFTFCCYLSLAMCVNRTRLRVSSDRLAIRNGPLPLKRNIDLPSKSISQLFVKQVVTPTQHGNVVHYELRVLLKDGRMITLLKGLEESEYGLSLEQEIEKLLGIEDRTIAGQV